MPQLMIFERTYYSAMDEANFFAWLQAIPGVVRVVGEPDGLRVFLRSSRLSEAVLRDLLAVHWRYGLPMRELAAFRTPSNEKWFAAPIMYWHDAVFGAKALPASVLQRRSEWLAAGLKLTDANRRVRREYGLASHQVRRLLAASGAEQ